MRNRTLLRIVAVLMLFGFTVFSEGEAQAANVVDIMATSTPITKIGCEQLGSLRFEFDPGSTLYRGDEFLIDLPAGVTICRPIDYLIVGQTDPSGLWVDISGPDPYAASFSIPELALPSALPAGSDLGPIAVIDAGGGTGVTISADQVAIRVRGSQGSQQLLIAVVGSSPSASIAVGANTYLRLNIADGEPHPDNILLDSNGDGIYGDIPIDDYLDPSPNPNPDLQLFANAEALADSILVFNASKNNNPNWPLRTFIFNGDNQLAHVVAADFTGFNPAVAYDSITNHFLAVYSKTVSGTDQLWYLVLDGDGNAVSAPAQLYHDVLYNWNPAIAFDNFNGVFLLVWEHHPSSLGESEIYGMQLKVRPDSSLAASGSFTVNCDQEDATYPLVANQTSPAVAFDSINGNFVVTWEDDRNESTNSGPGIFAQTVQGCDPIDGTLCAPRCFKPDSIELDNPVFDEAGSQTSPAIAFDPLKELFMTAGVHAPGGSSPQNIFVRPVDSSGNFIFYAGIQFPSDNVVGETSFDPSITYSPDNQLFLVTWHQMDGAGTQGIEGAFASVIYNFQNEPFTMTSPAFEITSSSELAEDAAVAYNPVDQKYLVTWWDDRNHLASGPELFGQYINTGGNLFGSRLTITDGVAMRSSALAPLPYISGFLSTYTRVDGGGLRIDWSTVPGLADTDGDGLTDGDETLVYGTDPNNPDSDGDGLWDGDEVNTYQTTPTDSDSDDDSYDDFLEVLRDSDPLEVTSTPMWQSDTFIRRIASGQLESVVASYGYKQSNSLVFADPINFSEFEAEVTVTEIHSKSSNTRARLGGRFFSYIDNQNISHDIWAEIGLRQTDTGLKAYYEIDSCGDAACIDWQEIVFAQGPDSLNLNQSYTLRIGYDAVSNQFTFGLDDQEYVFGTVDGLPANAGQPAYPQRFIGTRVSGSSFGPDSGGYVRALFDNVSVDGSLYDEFNGPMIDQSKWQTWEFVRDINAGTLHSEIAEYGANQSNHLFFANPELITGISADVSVTDLDNDTIQGGAFPTARIGGRYYNDGTPGTGSAGDIVAYVGIGPGGQANWHITRCLSGDCNNPGEYEQATDSNGIELADWAFLQVDVGDDVHLEISWDPGINRFVFTCENVTDGTSNTATVDGAPDVDGPPTFPFKSVGTRVGSIIPQSEEWGYIAANFENILFTTMVDTDGDGVTDFFDEFPTDANEWADTDGDGLGDNSDNCRDVYNPDQLNYDYPADNEGDVCDRDADNDGFISAYFEGDDCDDLNPNVFPDCPDTTPGCPCEGVSYTPPASDGCNVRTDCDNDGVVEKDDNCPGLPNNQDDTDGDEVGDACDNCPVWPNADQSLVTFYKDADQDGYYDGTTIVACPIDESGTPPTGYATLSSLQAMTIDCNDANPLVNPGGTEIPNNNLDDDCNSATPDILQDYQIVVQSITDADGNTYDPPGIWEPSYEGNAAVITVTFGVNGLGDTVPEENIISMSITPPPANDTGNPSRHAGQYVNDSGEEGLAIEDRSPDFSVDAVTDKTISLTSLDSGGTITVYVSATISLPDGGTLTLNNKPMTFPKDSDGDGIGDFYENLYGDLDPLADSDGDGLTSMEEYRGVRWKNMEKVDPNIDNGPYDVLAWVPKGTPKLIRTNPDRRDLFVMYTGFDADYPFAVNNGFDALQIDVHALDEETVRNDAGISDVYNIDSAYVVLADTTLGGLSPHITRRSERDWKFQTLGKSNIGEDQVYGAESIVYKKSLDAFFIDKPYFDNNTFDGDRANQMSVETNWSGSNLILDPLSKVEDGDDNGIMGSREDPYFNGHLDGDYPIPIGVSDQADPAYESKPFLPPSVDADPLRPGLDVDGDGTDETWDPRFDLSPFDVDNDGKVEINLPVVATSGEVDPLYENSKEQVLMLIVSHELGHGVGIGPHTSVSTCNMYNETNNFVRHIFSTDAAALIRIHND